MANVPIVTEVTKAQLDALVAANGLNEGLQYKVTDKDWIVVAQTGSTYLKIYGSDDTGIKAVYGVVPAINAGVRYVLQINVGVLQNRERALIAFHQYQNDHSEIPEIIKGLIQPKINAGQLCYGLSPAVVSKSLSDNYLLLFSSYENVFYITKDYTKSTRFIQPVGFGDTEKYNESSVLPTGRTYSEIGVGILVGWYSVNNSMVLTGNKSQIESIWLTDSGNDSIVNVAIKNVDSTPSYNSNYTLAVYE